MTTESYSYTPFGELLSGEGSGYRFNGEYYDSATGMLNLRARQYEPATMRFSQRDAWHGTPDIPITLNRYLYCIGDPVNLYDYGGNIISISKTGSRLPISLPLVKVASTKTQIDAESALKAIQQYIDEQADTGIDKSGLTDAQLKIVEDAENELREKATNGTLTASERNGIIGQTCEMVYRVEDSHEFKIKWERIGRRIPQ